MKIIISERHLKSIIVDPEILNEQGDASNDNAALNALQVAINEKLGAKQDEVLNQTVIKVKGPESNVQLQIGDKSYPMKLMHRDREKIVFAIVIPPNTRLSIGQINVQAITEEIQKMKEFQDLAERHPELKQQIASNTVTGVISTDEQNQGVFKFTVTRTLDTTEDRKLALPYGNDYLLGDFFKRNKLIYRLKNGAFGILESGAINIDLSGIQLKINPVRPQQQQPAQYTQFQPLQLQDSFNYNGVDFKDENATSQQVYAFVEQIKKAIENFGEPFIEHIKLQNPTVRGYASIDGDPNQKIIGEYKPCSGRGTRKDYDLCLSQARAKVIADMLNKALPELGGAFKYMGMGETTQWGPGWSPSSPTIPEQTAPNRRYVLSPIKPFIAKLSGTQQNLGRL